MWKGKWLTCVMGALTEGGGLDEDLPSPTQARFIAGARRGVWFLLCAQQGKT